jgi:redox-sensitive bicupin YhaK (pirin superfamily)
MSSVRRVERVLKSQPTVEGAGVRLKRAFMYQRVPELDPFLLMDDFGSDNPEDYNKGFPWHPHRGIETISYMLDGEIEHADSMGNCGVIGAGGIQWMTAGSGIIHQEMPHGEPAGRMHGFQLWANLPAVNKMMHPRYQDIAPEQVPVVTLDNGVKIKVLCGEVNGVIGPVKDVIIDPQYLDVSIPAGGSYTHHVHEGYTVFAYVIEGSGAFEPEQPDKSPAAIGIESVVIYGDGERVEIKADANGLRFLLLSGKPIREPVAWYGPIVMNTREELVTAFEEYQNGTFLKHQTGA